MTAESKHSAPAATSGSWLKVFLSILGLIAFGGFAFFTYIAVWTYDQIGPHTIIGNLGGIQVAIHSDCASGPIYAGAPEKPAEFPDFLSLKPRRQQHDSIKSINIRAQLDKKSCPGRKEPKDKTSWEEGHQVSIQLVALSGPHYSSPSDEIPHQSWKRRIKTFKSNPDPWLHQYERNPEREADDGLEAYTLVGLNPKNNRPAREHSQALDIYIHRIPSGEVDVYIECKPIEHKGSQSGTCSMYFSLRPKAVGYAKAHLHINHINKWRSVVQSTQNILNEHTVSVTKSN